MALRAYELAAEGARSWDRPFLEASRVLLRQGRLGRALSAAQDARRRAHDDTAAWVQTAKVRHELWQQRPTERNRLILESVVNGIQQNHPGDPGTLPILADLRRANGDVEGAGDVIARQTEQPGPAADTALALAEVSRRAQLNLEAGLLAGRDEPMIALHEARRLAAEGDPAAGQAVLEAGIEGARRQRRGTHPPHRSRPLPRTGRRRVGRRGVACAGGSACRRRDGAAGVAGFAAGPGGPGADPAGDREPPHDHRRRRVAVAAGAGPLAAR